MEAVSLEKDIELIRHVVDEQRRYFKTGVTGDVNYRIRTLKKLLKLIQDNESMLLEAVRKDLNKHPYEALSIELGPIYSELQHLIKHTREWSEPEYVKTSLFHTPGISRIIREPYGNVLVISPWNYPLLLSISPIMGAISAGNCVILTPSEQAPNTSAAMAELINTNFDRGHMHVIEGGIETTQALVAEKWDYIFFTGGTEVGRIIYLAAAKNLTPVTLELGGKSPCVIHKDANIHIAAKRVMWGKFISAGQTCLAPDYVFVHKDVKERFINALKSALVKAYGENALHSEDLGKIINQRHYERLKHYLNDGEIIHGGKFDDKTFRIEPTLLANVSTDSKVMTDEIFGPILPIHEYENLEEVIKFVNSREKPLGAYIFSSSRKVRNKFINSTSSGGVTENDTVLHISSSNMPFGGIGSSGIGGYHGKFSFDTFSHKKSVLHRMKHPLDWMLRYPPYGKKRLGLMRWMLKKFL